jgi:glucosyl-3-phosphoglycerate synthase
VTAPLSDRAPAGSQTLERPIRDTAWSSPETFPSERWGLERLLALKRESIALILPTREVAETIGAVLASLLPLADAGLVDELVVVDAASADGTAAIVRKRGATLLQESEILPEFGPALGKGDAMWRGLAATSGETVVYLDTDTRDFDERFLLGVLGPLLERPDLSLVKGAFRRPFKVDGMAALPDGGGRVTELVARPLLNLFMPELAGFTQPLAGETAARRDLLESLAYPVGYGVEVAMLIDAARRVGVETMAQVDLGTRQNRHQPLRELSAMAYAVLGAASRRFHDPGGVEAADGVIALPAEGGQELREVSLEERPPLRSLPLDARARVRGAASRSRLPRTAPSDRFTALTSR